MLTIDRVSTGRALVSDELFAQLTARIAHDHPELASDLPARIMDQALAFLAACATATDPLGPSDLVDIGWHTFILHTREYADFCQRIAGRFIHHQPEPTPDDPPSRPEPIGAPISRATAAIAAAGFALDHELWGGPVADCTSKCTQCHAGCTDSPTR
ncbi:glycine-rich domain-containing protein [Micromonospora echinaurantiaca]|uniref:glycine-rich domain-containing protein n=1 Tax=Micromonospora echinaurantiaca TaxID=47857 RepID=UPI00371334DD